MMKEGEYCWSIDVRARIGTVRCGMTIMRAYTTKQRRGVDGGIRYYDTIKNGLINNVQNHNGTCRCLGNFPIGFYSTYSFVGMPHALKEVSLRAIGRFFFVTISSIRCIFTSYWRALGVFWFNETKPNLPKEWYTFPELE